MNRRYFLWSLGVGAVAAALPALRGAPRLGCDQNCEEALKVMHDYAKRAGWPELQMFVSLEVGERLRGGGGFWQGRPFISFHWEHIPYRLDDNNSFVMPFLDGPVSRANPAWVFAEYELMLGCGGKDSGLHVVMFRRG